MINIETNRKGLFDMAEKNIIHRDNNYSDKDKKAINEKIINNFRRFIYSVLIYKSLKIKYNNYVFIIY